MVISVDKKIFIIFCFFIMLFMQQPKCMLVLAADVALVGVERFSVEGESLVPGNEAIIYLSVYNESSTTDAENVVLSISSNSGKLFPAYGTDNQYYLGNLDKGKTKEIEIPVRVGKDVNKEDIDMICTMSYLSGDTLLTNSVVVVLPVTKNTQVHLEIDNYSIDGDVLIPGKDSRLYLSIHNVSTTTKAENVIMTIMNSSGVVFPAYGTDNQYFLGTLDEDECKTIEIPLSVSNWLDAVGIELICEFNYLSNMEDISNRMTIVLPSTGGTPVAAKTVAVSPTAIINSKTLLSVTLWNNSSEDITDARLLISGPVSEDSKDIILDTLKSMQNHSEDCQITFIKMGDQMIDIALQYTDLNGQIRKSELGSYTVIVESSDTEFIIDSSNRTRRVGGLGITAVALGIVFVVVMYYIKKR